MRSRAMKKGTLTIGAALLGLTVALVILHAYDLSSLTNFTRVQVLERWPLRQWTPLRSTGITCNRTHPTYDLCSVNGPTLLDPKLSTLFLVDPAASHRGPAVSLKTRPYTRKRDLAAIRSVKELTLTSARPHNASCTVTHASPALVFSAGGYTWNFYHAFDDGLVPLFITASSFFPDRDVHLVVEDCPSWWPHKFKEMISRISSHPVIDMDRETGTHCFPSVVVGLIKHGPMTIDPALLPIPMTLRDFGAFVHDAYNGGQGGAIRLSNSGGHRTGLDRPRLVLVSRSQQAGRAILNQKKLVATAEKIGFDVTLFKPNLKTSMTDAFRLIDASHAMVGVHGAALTHLLFLRPGSVFLQVVPIAMEWVSETYFGTPARTLGLEYIEYKIKPNESSLAEKYGIDDMVLTNPTAVTKGNWANMKIYLTEQNVRLDLVRFRTCLEEAYVKAKRFMEETEGEGHFDKLVSNSRKLIN